MNQQIPWVEKYRPKCFEDIILDKTNKKILEALIEENSNVNILLYGPPGTGKTTTIINFISKYQKKYGEESKGLLMHLNASDDRGIDLIRNQLYQFVNSKHLFKKGTKFVVLDEVDYMTKTAQQALKTLFELSQKDVRFILICNYISKIDESIQNIIMKLRFYSLPIDLTTKFLKNICENENIKISDSKLLNLQKVYHSDVRSMINHIQFNFVIVMNLKKVITKKILDNIINKIIINDEDYDKTIKYLISIMNEYNIDIKTFITDLIMYLIEKKQCYDSKILTDLEYFFHFKYLEEINVLKYIIGIIIRINKI